MLRELLGRIDPLTKTSLVDGMLPVLGRSLDLGFNVLDVMHHGTHEKQLSNVFRWLLEAGGTHHFKTLGQRAFVEEVNLARGDQEPLPLSLYSVRQEVNTSDPGDSRDITDIVLESDTTAIVIENYETSDGHGHVYDRYLRFGQRAGKTAVVVLLCSREDRARLTSDWEKATVVTYERFLDRLVAELDQDSRYAAQNAEQYAFISQVHRKYGSGKERVSEREVLEFVTAMCVTGEAKRYRTQDRDLAAEQFASDLAQQARERFVEGPQVLQRVKAGLRSYGDSVLRQQLNASLQTDFVTRVTAGYQGIYQWSVNFDTIEEPSSFGEARLQLKFGPSAWFANEQDDAWKQKVPLDVADYSRVFLTRARGRTIRQSTVSLHEVLDGLGSDDLRLHDELLALIRTP